MNPERVTVTVSGAYLVQYRVHYRRQNIPHHGVARLYKNGTSEITGSFSELSVVAVSDVNENYILAGEVIVSLSANDYVTLQAGTNVHVANEIDMVDDDIVPDPTTRIYASLTILKIGP